MCVPLSNREIDNFLRSQFGIQGNPSSEILPENILSPFDNFYSDNIASENRIKNLERLAAEVAPQIAAKDEVKDCDQEINCLTRLINQYGKIFLSRSLTSDELNVLGTAAFEQMKLENSGSGAIDLAIRYFMLHPEFHLRFENNGSLTPVELLERLSYFLMGESPLEEDIAYVEQGGFDNLAGLEKLVDDMLTRSQTAKQVEFFTLAWLGLYGRGGNDGIDLQLKNETKALILATSFEGSKPWSDLFLAQESYITEDLADIYELPFLSADEYSWTPYTDSDRSGILGQSLFLSVGQKGGEESAALRGYNISKALFCGEIGAPPANVNVDIPFGETGCSIEDRKARLLNPLHYLLRVSCFYGWCGFWTLPF